MNRKKLRGLISTILIVTALLSLVTGGILYFLQYGMWLIFTRNFLNNVHVLSGLIMAIAVMIHFIINYRMYLAEINELLGKTKK